MSIPRFAWFREDSNLGSCINFQRKPRRTNSSQGARATSESLVTTSSCLSDRDKKTKSEPGHRRHHGSPPPEQQEFVSLQIASFANPAVRIELLSSTNVCKQLRHRRLPLLESAADEDLATRLNRLECQDIGDMFDSLPCSSSEFAMKTNCPPCEVPSGRMVHPASVYVNHNGRMMSMDFEWCSCPRSRLSEPVCAPHKSSPL